MSFVNSPITDLLLRIKNAYMARRQVVDWVMFSNFKLEILSLLKRYSFIENFEVVTDWSKKSIRVFLKEVKDASEDIPVVKLYSKPSRRYYVWKSSLNKVAGWRWIWIISTNKWVMATHEAYKQNLWWELIAEIY